LGETSLKEGERARDDQRRRAQRHCHAIADQWMNEPRGITQHEDVFVNGVFRLEVDLTDHQRPLRSRLEPM
jgi:hypothetical protein